MQDIQGVNKKTEDCFDLTPKKLIDKKKNGKIKYKIHVYRSTCHAKLNMVKMSINPVQQHSVRNKKACNTFAEY